MDRKNDKLEFTYVDLFFYLKSKILIIIAVAALVAFGGYLYYTWFVPREYTAETRIYVLNRTNSSTVVSSDFQSSTYVVNDYKVLITGRNVTQEAIDRLNLDMSNGTLSKKIAVTAPPNTRVLQISVTDTDPQRAADIANTVRQIASEQIQNIMEAGAVHLVYEADVPQNPSSATATKTAKIAALVGAAVAILCYVVVFILDNAIRTEEDVARYLDLSVLGVIPDSGDINHNPENRISKAIRLPRRKPVKK